MPLVKDNDMVEHSRRLEPISLSAYPFCQNRLTLAAMIAPLFASAMGASAQMRAMADLTYQFSSDYRLSIKHNAGARLVLRDRRVGEVNSEVHQHFPMQIRRNLHQLVRNPR